MNRSRLIFSRLPSKSVFATALAAPLSAREILEVAANSKLTFTATDADLFLRKLIRAGNVKKAGPHYAALTDRVISCLETTQDAATTRLLLTRFIELKCANTFMRVLPFYCKRMDEGMTVGDHVTVIWGLAVLHPKGDHRAVLDELVRRLRGRAGEMSRWMVYRAVFSLAKLNYREGRELYEQLAPKIRERIQKEPYGAFTPKELVRIGWAYGWQKVRDVPLFADLSKAYQQAIDELEYAELKVLKQLYHAMHFRDKELLWKVDQQLQVLQPLGPLNADFTPRRKPFKNKEQRVSMTDPLIRPLSKIKRRKLLGRK